MSATPTCDPSEHSPADALPEHPVCIESCRRAAAIFRALGDPARMQILAHLLDRELCVTEIAAALQDNLSAVSQRLKLLRSERVVAHRREGKHIYYSLADQHIAELVVNGLAHGSEQSVGRTAP